jgi:quinol monooxygenase YgiN
MIIVAGTMSFDPAARDQVAASMLAVTSKSRQDPGCVDYAWTEVLDAPGVFRFFECWESKADLDAHMGLAHVVEFTDTTLSQITDVTAASYTATRD